MRGSRQNLALLLVLVGALTAAAQEDKPAPPPDTKAAAAPRPNTDALTAWEWYADVTLPKWEEPPRWADFILTPGVLDKARPDLGDLRLIDSKDQLVPYALRILRARNEQVPVNSREFDRATNPDRSAEISLDLEPVLTDHNEIEVAVSGNNFRRKIRLEGSSDAKTWKMMPLDKEFLVNFQVDVPTAETRTQTVEVRRFHYTNSRYRYLRVRVFADTGLMEDKPEIRSVTVHRTLRLPGEMVTRPANLGPREPERGEGAPGSAWMIELGAKVPVERLRFAIDEREFSRQFRVEAQDLDDDSFYTVQSGHWQRKPGDKPGPLVVIFSDPPFRRPANFIPAQQEERVNEVTTRKLRLIVTDNNNPPLTITKVEYAAPARQVVFTPLPELAPPLRLYFGQPKALPPRYDYEATVPAALEPAPPRGSLEPNQKNPNYVPPPKPLTERWPWLVYVVLAGASLVLLGLLSALGKEAIAQHDAGAVGVGTSSQE